MDNCEHKKFLDIRMRDKPLYECELVWSDDTYEPDNTRLYIDRLEAQAGFYAHAVEFVSCSADVENYWIDESLIVSSIFQVTAYWDGVRHLEFNRNNDCDMNGYLYYPSMPDLISMLQKIREIELECCRETS